MYTTYWVGKEAYTTMVGREAYHQGIQGDTWLYTTRVYREVPDYTPPWVYHSRVHLSHPGGIPGGVPHPGVYQEGYHTQRYL